MQNPRRVQLLTRSIKFGFALIIGALLFVMFSGLSGGISNNIHPDSDNLVIGETRGQVIEGKRMWVTRFSQNQQQQLAIITAHVQVLSTSCQLTQQICQLATATDLPGVDWRYVKARPDQLKTRQTQSLPWVGGFVNPADGRVLDLAGREYLF